MYKWKSFPEIERGLKAERYKPFYNPIDESYIISELCPACGVFLKYIGYMNIHTYKAFMYCGLCRYWEEYSAVPALGTDL
ncbi:MAG: hypothetical protein APF84_08385 [Gracilibacter sp. BRH_c7a]|nr:MAG: hypothetical protein APF84_08385 [Gracilibacter sp. BRH_c7a]